MADELDPGDCHGRVGGAGRRAPSPIPHGHAEQQQHDNDQQCPAGPHGHVGVLDRDDLRGNDAVQAARADDHQDHALQAKEQAKRHHERWNTNLGYEEADGESDDETDAERNQQRERPRDAVWLRESHEHRHRHAERDTGRQVNLAEQEHKHEGHAQCAQRGSLSDQVGHVALGEEVADPRSVKIAISTMRPPRRAGRPFRRRAPAGCTR